MRFEGTPFWFYAENADLARAMRRRTLALLGTVLRASACVLAAAGIAAVATKSAPVWWIYGAFGVALGTALVLDFAKRKREAGVALSLGFWMASTAAVFFLGGVRSPGSFVYLPIIITAGLFWSWRAAAVLAAASLGAVGLAAWLDEIHLLPLPLQAPTNGPLLRIFAGSLTMTAVLVGVAMHALRTALQDGRRQAVRTEELLLNVPDVLAVLDRLGVILAVSPALAERTGYEPNELVGKHASRVELFGQDRRLVVDDLRLLGVHGGEGARELALRCRDGGRAWGEARLHALPLGNGDSLRRIVLYDVTRRHIAEARQAELEMRVEQSRRLETVGLLAGGVAHDFNNLLTVILSLGSLLDEKLQADSPARQLLTEINESAVRAAELARNLLTADPTKTLEALDVGRELVALSPMLSRMAGDRISVAIRIHAEPCAVRMDKVSLERIATNLIANARDAMPSGGEIVVEIAPSTDAAGGKSPRRVIELSVADTGVGMDSLTRQRIFEPFYTTKGVAGTGLGLATVESIVRRFGGSIVVDSRPGGGTTVRVLLPEASSGAVSSPSTAYGTRRE